MAIRQRDRQRDRDWDHIHIHRLPSLHFHPTFPAPLMIVDAAAERTVAELMAAEVTAQTAAEQTVAELTAVTAAEVTARAIAERTVAERTAMPAAATVETAVHLRCKILVIDPKTVLQIAATLGLDRSTHSIVPVPPVAAQVAAQVSD